MRRFASVLALSAAACATHAEPVAYVDTSSGPDPGAQAAPVVRAEIVGERDPDVPDVIRRKATVTPPPRAPADQRAAPVALPPGELRQPLPLTPAGFPWLISPAKFVELCRQRGGKAGRVREDAWRCELTVDEPVPINWISAKFCDERLCQLRLDLEFAHHVSFTLARESLEARYRTPKSRASTQCVGFDILQWFFMPDPSKQEWFGGGGGDIMLSATCVERTVTMSIGYWHESWHRHRVLKKQRDAQSW